MSNILDKLAKAVDAIEDKMNGKGEEEKEVKKTTVKKTQDAEKDAKKKSIMDELIGEDSLNLPQAGDVVEGEVIEVTPSALYLDLGVSGTGIVMGREIKDGLSIGKKIKIGDKVQATIVDLENEDGYIELSIREASYEKAWDDLESKRDSQETIATRILSANKGGLMVELNGITGFLPVSQLSSEHYPRVEDGDKNKILEHLKTFMGTDMQVRIIDAERETEKLIVSEKAAASDKERKVISKLKVGDVIEGEVSGVVDFGAFVKFFPPGVEGMDQKDQLEGLVHISELAWQLIDDPRDIIKTGDRIQAKIISIDDTRISLSIRALKADPWKEVEKKYKAGDIVKGEVRKVNHFGAFVYLDKDIHGLAHISELQTQLAGKSVEDSVKVGSEYKWKILSIEPENHRMGLEIVKS